MESVICSLIAQHVSGIYHIMYFAAFFKKWKQFYAT